MSKRLRIQTDMAFDSAGTTTDITLTPTTERFLDTLTLELTNRGEKVLVQGVFAISIPPITAVATGEIFAQVKFYRDADQTNLAYQVNQTLLATGVAIVAPGTPASIHQVPVQFEEVPPLKVTEDTVNYYVTITVFNSGLAITAGDIVLTQYSIVAQEIAQ